MMDKKKQILLLCLIFIVSLAAYEKNVSQNTDNSSTQQDAESTSKGEALITQDDETDTPTGKQYTQQDKETFEKRLDDVENMQPEKDAPEKKLKEGELEILDSALSYNHFPGTSDNTDTLDNADTFDGLSDESLPEYYPGAY